LTGYADVLAAVDSVSLALAILCAGAAGMGHGIAQALVHALRRIVAPAAHALSGRGDADGAGAIEGITVALIIRGAVSAVVGSIADFAADTNL